MSWDEPSPTVTTQFYGYGNGRFGHPEQDRALSYRDGALLQSFPIDYDFVENKSDRQFVLNTIADTLLDMGKISRDEHLKLYTENHNHP